jgi:hypothetical protein
MNHPKRRARRWWPFLSTSVCVIFAFWLSISTATATQAMQRFSDPHTLMTQALRTGSAKGVMTGAIDEQFSRQFHSTGILSVQARVIKALARSDCKRLEIIFTKADVDTPKGRTQAILTTELDYCLDGGPPNSQSSTGMSP